MFGNISRNVWGHSPEYLATFPGMFGNILRDVWRHSPECLRTFPGMFGNILRNVWWHSPEYNIPLIPCAPRIPFPVPVLLVLYIAFATVFEKQPFRKISEIKLSSEAAIKIHFSLSLFGIYSEILWKITVTECNF